MANVLDLRDVFVAYGQIQALKGVSLAVAAGELVAIVGGNGAGKTTLLLTISGLLRPLRGSIRYGQADLTRMPPHEIVRAGIAHCPEGRQIFARLSVAENLALGAYNRRDRREVEQDRAWVESLFPRLTERWRQPAGTLSGGEQQMLAIGRALMSRPRVLLLDEPSLGLAPLLVERIFDTLQMLRERHVTMLLVEQNAYQALRVADRAYVLETGRIILEGPARDIADHEAVKAAYLGG
jgi:branched-chain amino acid transport system ATP-binding protein